MTDTTPINETGSVKTGVEFPKELLKLVQKRVIDREIMMKDAVREAFTLWLNAEMDRPGLGKPLDVSLHPDVISLSRAEAAEFDAEIKRRLRDLDALEKAIRRIFKELERVGTALEAKKGERRSKSTGR